MQETRLILDVKQEKVGMVDRKNKVKLVLMFTGATA
jgi:hypothetical protein